MAPATRYAKTRVASTPAPSKRRPAAVETAEPEQRASRSRVTRDGKFTSLEMNGYGRGNRPVRAVVNAATARQPRASSKRPPRPRCSQMNGTRAYGAPAGQADPGPRPPDVGRPRDPRVPRDQRVLFRRADLPLITSRRRRRGRDVDIYPWGPSLRAGIKSRGGRTAREGRSDRRGRGSRLLRRGCRRG